MESELEWNDDEVDYWELVVYVYVYTHIHIHMHIHVHVHIHIEAHYLNLGAPY